MPIFTCSKCKKEYMGVRRTSKFCKPCKMPKIRFKYPNGCPAPVIKEKRVKKPKLDSVKKKRYTKPYRKKIACREELFTKSNNICSDCNQIFPQYFLAIHHINYRSNGGPDDPDNLVVICKGCHIDRHEGEPVSRLMLKEVLK